MVQANRLLCSASQWSARTLLYELGALAAPHRCNDLLTLALQECAVGKLPSTLLTNFVCWLCTLLVFRDICVFNEGRLYILGSRKHDVHHLV